MPNPQTYGARGLRKRDIQLCKTVFVAAISQILYARRAFPSNFFHVLPLSDLVSKTYEEIMASGSGIPTFDREILREQSTTVFLHQDVDYDLKRFLGILTHDIFPILETENLARFRISFLRSTTWDENCLIEYYTLVFKYPPDGKCGIDIWRAGIGEQHISDTNFKLWNLGDYLNRLPSLKGPLYWAMAFHANELPDIPTIGFWKFDRTEFDDANLKLQQKEGYRYDRIASLEIEPLRSDSQQIESIPVVPVSQSTNNHKPSSPSVQLDTTPQELEAPKPRKQANTKRKAVQEQLRAINTRQRTLRAQETEKVNPPSKAKETKAGHKASPVQNRGSQGKTTAKGLQKKATRPSAKKPNAKAKQVTKTAQKPASTQKQAPTPGRPSTQKRKPKRPLQIYEDVTSNLPETQEVARESQTQQSQLSGTRSSKRLAANDGGPVGGNVSNTRAKRVKATHPPPPPPPPPARMSSTPDAQVVSDFLESIDEDHLLDTPPDAQRGPPSFAVTPAFLRSDPVPENMENATAGDEDIGDSLISDPNNRYPPTDMSFDFQPLLTSQTERMFPGILDSEDEDSPIACIISRSSQSLDGSR
ncbi:hypothetical protein NEUTE1DRAFT_49553 [Neurospora tetrasperma FGSC 2508]|uniref:HORMA domain-containing protein n=1 Tax=Neurospora tetrasperma (strain FGSC 2508 / ATCC MYA-4615 / P0657) TaxID=510951 RepID=F8MVD5_NEUT8|nr:uncharacterized protein NEUTE1DRAFT_49553 [Neurospora tetrasperma FGSC 2508]EGO54738.1 hypothetical protein NEUTE1DRAFT_49553 [Neurospora tetrasperma FGSC 2508]EGZ67785.1 hypothetical protein NEUTE2DRAFT_132459 [Neurospora tetrasperma FGSC 2509]